MRPSRASRVSRGLLAAGVATFVALHRGERAWDGYVARRDSIRSMRTSGRRRRSPTMTFAEAGVA